jgi:hypothetical protein
LRTAGGDDELISGLAEVAVCRQVLQAQEEEQGRREPEPAAEREVETRSGPATYSPSSAALRSLFIPGLGQFYTGSPAAGGLFLAGWAGALGFGLMSQEVTTYCLAQATDTCPSGSIRDQVTERPNMMIGVGAAAALAVASALHARSAANKANARGFAGGGEEDAAGASVTLRLFPAELPRRPTDMVLVQLRF